MDLNSSGPGSIDNEVPGTSPSVSYLRHLLRRSYSSAEMQSTYSTALVDRADN